MEKRIIGVNSLGYRERRNFADLPFTRYRVEKKKDLVKLPAWLYWKLKGDTHPKWLNLFNDFGLNKVDIFHFFNAFNVQNSPWVVSFPHYIPTWCHRPGARPGENKDIEWALKRLAHPSCKKLMAMSHYAAQSEQNYLDEWGSMHEDIVPKITIMHPAQDLVIHDISEKQLDPDFLTCCIVGADFFRKGGTEILHVFDRLLQENVPIKLVVVSKLDIGDYASQATEDDRREAIKLMDKHDNIIYHERLPNSEVLRLFTNSDIGLLPTYDDTYGYSVLEAQACGCPVVTTNGGVMPEINNDKAGWMIEVPLVEDNRSIPRTAPEKQIFREIVEAKLYDQLIDAVNNRAQVLERGRVSLERIRTEHDPIANAAKLEAIYDEALR